MHAPGSTSYVPEVTVVVDAGERAHAESASAAAESTSTDALVLRRERPREPRTSSVVISSIASTSLTRKHAPSRGPTGAEDRPATMSSPETPPGGRARATELA